MGSRSQATMSSGALRKLHHRRNPSQHQELVDLLDTMNRDSAASSKPKLLRWQQRASSKTRDSDTEEKENHSDRVQRQHTPKKVSWSKELLQVRPISPRQCRRRIPSPRAPPSSHRIESSPSGYNNNNTINNSPLSSTSNTVLDDCGHYLCHRLGGGRCTMEDPRGSNYPSSLPCSPQMQTVVWRSIPITRTDLNLDLRSSFILPGEGMV